MRPVSFKNFILDKLKFNCFKCGHNLFRIIDTDGPAYELACEKCNASFLVGEHEHCDGDCI